MRRYDGWAAPTLLAILVIAACGGSGGGDDDDTASAGCTSDSDCEGDLLCEDGECVAAPSSGSHFSDVCRNDCAQSFACEKENGGESQNELQRCLAGCAATDQQYSESLKNVMTAAMANCQDKTACDYTQCLQGGLGTCAQQDEECSRLNCCIGYVCASDGFCSPLEVPGGDGSGAFCFSTMDCPPGQECNSITAECVACADPADCAR